MNVRPTAVTVIGWILIVLGALTLLTTSLALNNPLAREMMARSPLPIYVQFVITYASSLVSITNGIGILKGQNWARLLYVIWNIIIIVIGLATSPMKATYVPGTVILIVITFLLFRPSANEFFRKGASTGGLHATPDDAHRN